jgi:DNA-binding response OmpR family regulator
MTSSETLPTLLIVDDEPALRLLLNEFFKKTFQIVTLKDGLECMSYLQSHSMPLVAIVDLEMPGMGGLEVIKNVRANPQWNALIIIILSSRESSKDRIACLRGGADDYLVKPFNPDELDARIQAIFRRVKLHGKG